MCIFFQFSLMRNWIKMKSRWPPSIHQFCWVIAGDLGCWVPPLFPPSLSLSLSAVVYRASGSSVPCRVRCPGTLASSARTSGQAKAGQTWKKMEKNKSNSIPILNKRDASDVKRLIFLHVFLLIGIFQFFVFLNCCIFWFSGRSVKDQRYQW